MGLFLKPMRYDAASLDLPAMNLPLYYSSVTKDRKVSSNPAFRPMRRTPADYKRRLLQTQRVLHPILRVGCCLEAAIRLSPVPARTSGCAACCASGGWGLNPRLLSLLVAACKRSSRCQQCSRPAAAAAGWPAAAVPPVARVVPTRCSSLRRWSRHKDSSPEQQTVISI